MSATFDDLRPDERELVGGWTDEDSGSSPDAVDQRIFFLVTRRLEKRALVHGGWDQLFLDPRDGRLWELTFPRGSLFGGGPRRLAVIAPEDARAKYGADAVATPSD